MKGRIVLITGGAKGIGRATALAFAERGYNVAIAYNRSQEQAFSLVGELQSREINCCGSYKARRSRGAVRAVQKRFRLCRYRYKQRRSMPLQPRDRRRLRRLRSGDVCQFRLGFLGLPLVCQRYDRSPNGQYRQYFVRLG